MGTINSDEHDAEHGVRSGREQQLAPEQRDKPGAYLISTGQLRENKGGDVKCTGASVRTSEHDRPIFMSVKDPGVMYFTGPITAACVARFAQLLRARPRSATSTPHSMPKAHFFRPPRKKRR